MASEVRRRTLGDRVRSMPRKVRIGVLAAGLVAAFTMVPMTLAGAQETDPQEAPNTAAAPDFKSPFACGKTFYANNWIGTPAHNPKNSIDWQNHGGDDINKEPVHSSAAGTATFYDLGNTSYGKYIIVKHADGWSTLYAHLSSMVQNAGTTLDVEQGTMIGNVGNTGTNAPHLHYEQKLDGNNQTPVVEGTSVPEGSKPAITSTNACDGSANPYKPEEVCGSGFAELESQALAEVGTTHLLQNASDKKYCVVTLKETKIGTASPVSAHLEVEGETPDTDSGDFAYYAGPLTVDAASACIKWGGSVDDTEYLSDFVNC